jgi:hypothetical protein
MYLLGSDYKTVWQLAHNWTGQDSQSDFPPTPSPEVKESIHRIFIAIRNKLISVRTKSRVIMGGDDFLDVLFDIKHDLKFHACLKKDQFDKEYLDSLYVWRPEVLRWCQKDMLPVPIFWQPNLEIEFSGEIEADEEHWYKQLTSRKKSIIAALHIAERIWQGDKSLLYEDVLNHDDMKKYNKPQIFPSLDSFKEWARDIAPQEAKTGGRRKQSV